MNEKFHFGLETAFEQEVYKISITKEEGTGKLVAKKEDTLINRYEVFGEEGIVEKSSDILSEIVHIANKRTSNNEKRLFKQFLERWGFFHKGNRQTFEGFWKEINEVDMLLKKYSQVVDGSVEDLNQWIIPKNLELSGDNKRDKPIAIEKRIFELIGKTGVVDSKTYSIREGYETRVYYKDSKFQFDTKVDLKDISVNSKVYYQLFGFAFVASQIEAKLTWKPSFRNISVRQDEENSAFEGMRINPIIVPEDFLGAIYTMLLSLITKKQRICAYAKCRRPFNPSRDNNLYCEDKCRMNAKKQRYRERKKES